MPPALQQWRSLKRKPLRVSASTIMRRKRSCCVLVKATFSSPSSSATQKCVKTPSTSSPGSLSTARMSRRLSSKCASSHKKPSLPMPVSSLMCTFIFLPHFTAASENASAMSKLCTACVMSSARMRSAWSAGVKPSISTGSATPPRRTSSHSSMFDTAR